MNSSSFSGLIVGAALGCGIPVCSASAGSFTYAVLSPHGQQAAAYAVNSAGQVTGSYGDHKEHPFVWQNGTLTLIPKPKGTNYIESGPINASGVTTGRARLNQAPFYPWGIYLFDTKTGKSTFQYVLQSDAEKVPAYVNGIDDAGDVVGFIREDEYDGFGYILAGNQLTRLNPFGSMVAEASAVSGMGEVAGIYTTDAATYGFTDAGGTITTIQAENSGNTEPLFVSNSGVVTGYYATASGTAGFVYTAGVITSYQDPGSTYTRIVGVGPNGAVYGNAIDSQGIQHGFVYLKGAYNHITPPTGQGETTIVGSNETTGTIVGYFLGPKLHTLGFVGVCAAGQTCTN